MYLDIAYGLEPVPSVFIVFEYAIQAVGTFAPLTTTHTIGFEHEHFDHSGFFLTYTALALGPASLEARIQTIKLRLSQYRWSGLYLDVVS